MKIKRLIVVAMIALVFCSAGVYASESQQAKYDIADLGLNLELPASYSYVFTRDMDADDPILADLGLTKEDLFENESLYLEALSEDQNDEFVVTMMATDWSKLYYDFNDLDNNDLMQMAQTALLEEDASANMNFSEFSVFEGNSQAKFIKAEGKLTAEDANGYALQYVTVLNGNAYTFTFNFYDGAITGAEENMTKQVLATVSFDNIQKKAEGSSEIFYIVIIAVMAVIIAALVFVIRKKKYTVAITGNNGGSAVDATPPTVAEEPASEVQNETKLPEQDNEAEK